MVNDIFCRHLDISLSFFRGRLSDCKLALAWPQPYKEIF
jgi:hypothetical protein